MKDYVFAGGTAVVTGAASGIGAALADGLAARRSDLVLLDRDGERLAQVAARLRAEHLEVGVRTHVVDLGDRAATAAAAAALLAESPRVTLLVNNASTATLGRFDQTDLDQVWQLLDVNLRGTVHLTHALLPALRASPGSHLANVSSAFGLFAAPRQAAYVASKFAVRGFTESLRAELRPLGIGVTSVHPGGTRTRLPQHTAAGDGVPADEARVQFRAFERILTMAPEHVAEAILTGVEHRRPRVLVGWSARVPDLLVRVAPGAYTQLTAAGEAVIGWGLPRVLRRRR